MLYSFLLTVVAVALACYAGAAYAWKVAKNYIKDELASSEAKLEQQLRRENPGGCIHEGFTMGWINLLLQALWIPVLEKHIAGLTAELLHKIFNAVRQKHANEMPWSLIESIAVEELTFGKCPPTFQNALATYDPATSVMSIATDAEVVSNSAQAVLVVKTKPMPLLGPRTLRLEATRVNLKGRLKLGIVFGSEPPGIAGIYYSFVKAPSLSISVRPLGTPLPPNFDVGLTDALKKALKGIISRRMVEPQRRFFDMQRMYINRHVARIGGPGGLVRIHVQYASRLYRVRTDANAQAGAPPVKYSTFCQVKLAGQHEALRTPVAHSDSSSTAVWCWQLAFALPAELTAAAVAAGHAVYCSLSVFSAQTVGEPVLLAQGRVNLSTLRLLPNTAPKPITVPLQGAGSKDATLQLEVTWLKSTKQQPGTQQTHEQRSHQQQQHHHQKQQGNSHNSSDASVLAGAAGQPSYTTSTPAVSATSSAACSAAGQAAYVSSPGKSVSWHDEKSMELKGAEVAEASTAAAADTEAPIASLPQHRPSRSASCSPLYLMPSPAAASAGSCSNTPRRSITLDLSSLGGSNDVPPSSTPPESPLTTAAEASVGQQAAAAAALTAGDSTVDLNPNCVQQHQHGQQAQEQQLLTPGSNWLWPSTSSWGSWLRLGSPRPAAVAVVDTAARDAPPLSGGLGSASVTVPSSGAATSAAAAAAYSVPSTPGGAAADNSRANSPLAMLASAVNMQRQTELQQQQVAALQKQLADATHRELQSQQHLRSTARAALLQGGRFLLHCQDGTAQHVLLYLSQNPALPTDIGRRSIGNSIPSSSEGGSLNAANQPQQPCLVVAALPTCRQVDWRPEPFAQHQSLAGTISRAATHLHLLRSTAPGTVISVAVENGGAAAEAVQQASHNPLSRCFAKRQRQQLAKLAYESGEYLREHLPRLQVVAVSNMVSVQQGMQCPQQQTSGSLTGVDRKRASNSSAVSSNASRDAATSKQQLDIISVVFKVLGGEELSLHLQVPPVGNGRSVDEWVFALQQLIDW